MLKQNDLITCTEHPEWGTWRVTEEEAAENTETRIKSDPGQLTLAERYLRMAAHTYQHVWRD